MARNERVILASGSPRRAEICRLMGVRFEVVPSADEPASDPSLTAAQAGRALARSKGAPVAAGHPDRILLSADTTVIAPDGERLGKPADRDDAVRMLRLLSGKTHRVMTGVWLYTPAGTVSFTDVARVTFSPMSAADILAYVDGGEPYNKAGAYAVQGEGMRFIRRLEGDFYTVMGLPGARLYRVLQRCCPDVLK